MTQNAQTHDTLLRNYLRKHGVTQMQLAKALGISQGNVGHWLSGRQRISTHYAVKLEKVTNGEITRRTLYPELFEDCDGDLE